MKDGSLRSILLCSAVNFALKNEDEQNAIVYQYQNFLNSLAFPIEVVVQSRKLDLGRYIKELRSLKDRQPSELLRIQTEDYANFIEQLIQFANIMDKRFFTVVPYFSSGFRKVGFFGRLFRTGRPASILTDDQFRIGKEKLTERTQIIASGLAGLGVRAIQLDSEELIELLYLSYNQELAVNEHLTPTEELTAAVVQKADYKETEG